MALKKGHLARKPGSCDKTRDPGFPFKKTDIKNIARHVPGDILSEIICSPLKPLG